MIEIRTEHPTDHIAVAQVNLAAFGQDNEGRLVAALRRAEGFDPSLSLVAGRLGRPAGLWYYLDMQSKAKTVQQYLAELPDDRRGALRAVRSVILKNLPKGYAEGMQYGMIGYFVPHSVYPPGYHCNPTQPLPFAGLASQKNYMSIHLMCIYCDAEQQAWFREAWAQSGKKLDMGKSCVRFKKLDDLALSVIGQAIKRVPVKKFIAFYESVITPKGKSAKPAGRKKTHAKKVAKKSPRKSSSARKRKSTSKRAPKRKA